MIWLPSTHTISLPTSCFTCSAVTTPIASSSPSILYFSPGSSLEVLLRFYFLQEVFSDCLSSLLTSYSMQSSKMASHMESSVLLTPPVESELREKVGSILEVNLREGRGYHQRTFEERLLEEGLLLSLRGWVEQELTLFIFPFPSTVLDTFASFLNVYRINDWIRWLTNHLIIHSSRFKELCVGSFQPCLTCPLPLNSWFQTKIWFQAPQTTKRETWGDSPFISDRMTWRTPLKLLLRSCQCPVPRSSERFSPAELKQTSWKWLSTGLSWFPCPHPSTLLNRTTGSSPLPLQRESPRCLACECFAVLYCDHNWGKGWIRSDRLLSNGSHTCSLPQKWSSWPLLCPYPTLPSGSA